VPKLHQLRLVNSVRLTSVEVASSTNAMGGMYQVKPAFETYSRFAGSFSFADSRAGTLVLVTCDLARILNRPRLSSFLQQDAWKVALGCAHYIVCSLHKFDSKASKRHNLFPTSSSSRSLLVFRTSARSSGKPVSSLIQDKTFKLWLARLFLWDATILVSAAFWSDPILLLWSAGHLARACFMTD
jgi:hypothetical protein